MLRKRYLDQMADLENVGPNERLRRIVEMAHGEVLEQIEELPEELLG